MRHGSQSVFFTPSEVVHGVRIRGRGDHVDVDSGEVGDVPGTERLRNARAPVPALGAIMLVAETGHQLIPCIRNSLDTPAGLGGLVAEAESRQRRAHQVEGVGGVPVVCNWVGERPDGLTELDDRAGPAVRHDQRERAGLRRPHAQETNAGTVDAGAELRKPVETGLTRPPALAPQPLPAQVTEVAEADALPPVRHCPRICPAPPAPPLPQGLEVYFGDRY